MTIDFAVQVWREGSQFIAHAMPLDVSSCGATAEAASRALDEAVRAFVLTAEEHGTLEDVLQEAGYEREADGWRAPDCVALDHRIMAVAA